MLLHLKPFPTHLPLTLSFEYLLLEEPDKNVHPQWWLAHNHTSVWSPLHDSSERSDCSALQCIVAVSQSAYLHHLQLHNVRKVKLWGVMILSKVIWAGGLFFPTGSQLWTLTLTCMTCSPGVNFHLLLSITLVHTHKTVFFFVTSYRNKICS